MEFFYEFGLFLAKALTVVVAVIAVAVAIFFPVAPWARPG